MPAMPVPDACLRSTRRPGASVSSRTGSACGKARKHRDTHRNPVSAKSPGHTAIQFRCVPVFACPGVRRCVCPLGVCPGVRCPSPSLRKCGARRRRKQPLAPKVLGVFTLCHLPVSGHRRLRARHGPVGGGGSLATTAGEAWPRPYALLMSTPGSLKNKPSRGPSPPT